MLLKYLKQVSPHLIAIAIFIGISMVYFSAAIEGKVVTGQNNLTSLWMDKESSDFINLINADY